jgi:HK97 family phage portal protein
MTIVQDMIRGFTGFRSSITLDNINLSQDFNAGGNRSGVGAGLIPLVGNKSATYEALYRTQPWIRAIVDRQVGNIGRLPWAAFVEGGQPGERTKLREGPLADLLSSPYEGGNASLLKQGIAFNLIVHSNAVCVKVRNRANPPSELIPSSFAQWHILRGKMRPVDWYYWRNPWTGAVLPFLPEEVVHVRMWGGSDGVLGTSKLEALRTTLQNEDAVQRATIAAFENGMIAAGAYSVDGTLKPETAERLRAMLQENYGGVDNAFKIMLLEGGAKWQDMTHSFLDSELTTLRKLNREKAGAVHKHQMPAFGLNETHAYASIVEQHLMEYQDTLGPYTTMIEETLQTQLIDPEPAFEGAYVEFNYKDVLKGDPVKEIATLTAAVGGPFMTPNEARATQNMTPLPDPEASKLLPPPNASVKAPPDAGTKGD